MQPRVGEDRSRPEVWGALIAAVGQVKRFLQSLMRRTVWNMKRCSSQVLFGWSKGSCNGVRPGQERIVEVEF